MLNVLITAGPTREYIDPIRYISNKSSGKMGFCLAEAFAEKGAKVQLVTGPSEISNECRGLSPDRSSGDCPQTGAISVTKVETAEEMRQAVLKHFAWADIVVMAAAVADYRPVKISKQKIKKDAVSPFSKGGLRGIFELKLEKTPDILAELGQKKRKDQILIGFALETENLIENAKRKLQEKNLDLIIANNEKTPGAKIASFIVIEKDKEEVVGPIAKESFGQLLVAKLIKL